MWVLWVFICYGCGCGQVGSSSAKKTASGEDAREGAVAAVGRKAESGTAKRAKVLEDFDEEDFEKELGL